MEQYGRKAATVVLWQIGMLLLVYTIIRFLFYIYNKMHFPDPLPAYFVGGLRFDLSAIAYLNAPYLIAMLLPLAVTEKKWYRRICNIYFVTVNSLALSVKELATSIKQTDDNVEQIRTQVIELHEKPVKRWDRPLRTRHNQHQRHHSKDRKCEIYRLQ